MRFLAVLLSCFLGPAFCAASNAQLVQIHTVYLLPMANGFDQYLANCITNAGLFQVVADPKKADAIFTDHLGEAFESRLNELFPLPMPPQPAAAKQQSGASAGTAAAETPAKDQSFAAQATRGSAFTRAKGTLFLVDSRARTVAWSVYEKPKNTSPQELDRVAERIVIRLQRELKRK